VRRPAVVTALCVALLVAGGACSYRDDEPDEPSTTVFCEDHATIEANFASLPTGSLAELRAGVEQLADDAEGLAGRAPSAVAADAEAVAAWLRQASDAVAGAATVEEARAAAAAVVDEDAYQAASDGVAGWVQDNCPEG
jgi:hypothetical protein